MEKTYNPALIQRTQRYMETHSISQNQFAAKVNLSSAALSSYLNQKYKGSVEAVERQLSEFFKLDEEAEAAAEKTASLLPRAAYVPTSISEDVCQSIRFAQLEHCMVVLHGDAGVGKSKGAQKFLRDHPTNAVGISITPSTGTLNGSIKLLARALRVPECRNKMDQMMALRSRLDGTNWVIVIDEAQHLKYAALEEIRSLTDDNPMTGEHGVGVVLIGNSEVYSRLQGRQQAQFAQLFSRIRMQREYTTRKVKEDDVRKLFPVLAEQDARKEMDFLLSVCRSPWGIRGAMNLYTNAASANDVSYENLYRMAAHMGIGRSAPKTRPSSRTSTPSTASSLTAMVSSLTGWSARVPSHTKAASSLRSAPSRSTARARYSTSGTVASERARSTTASRPAPRISAGLTSEPTSSRPLPKSGRRCRTRRPALKMQRRRPAMQTRLQSLPPTTLRPPRNRQTMQQLPPKRQAMRQLRLSRRA